MNKTAPNRIYVTVNSDFDHTGYVHPRSITWNDGRVFQIEKVRDFRPMADMETGRGTDCYTVVIRGEEKHLFFERLDPRFASRLGRWYVQGSAG